jgi:hypothetical protein
LTLGYEREEVLLKNPEVIALEPDMKNLAKRKSMGIMAMTSQVTAS